MPLMVKHHSLCNDRIKLVHKNECNLYNTKYKSKSAPVYRRKCVDRCLPNDKAFFRLHTKLDDHLHSAS